MEEKFIKILLPLGIPGVSLGIFYLLLASFDFKFSAIDPLMSSIIVLVMLGMLGGLIFYALRYLVVHPNHSDTHERTNGCKVANIYWSGSDLMKALCATKNKHKAYLIRHCIVQFLHQIHSSGLITSSNKFASLRLLEEYPDILSKVPEDQPLNESHHSKLVNILSKVKVEMTGYIDGLQVDYVPYPKDNKKTWYEIKSSGIDVC